MIGERENIYQNTNYGSLVMRPYNIDGNDINAFYDANDNLVFVLDNTVNAQKPNVLLVINPDGDKKWDEILSSEYGVDLETVRPKVDNKYQKLDIEYSGLGVYESLINAYNAGDSLEEHLNQLTILRDSASRHSAMLRLNAANEIISKTNATIVKTKESIVRLETRIKTLRSKLSATKKEIGRVNTKQSASKILKLESQIEATTEKLKRAKKRLDSAQKRLEIATVDAELASGLLNQPSTQIKQTTKSKPVVVAPEYPVQTINAEKEEEMSDDDNKEYFEEDDKGVKPLLNEDPQILNEDIAFKPISFETPVFDAVEPKYESEAPVVDNKTFESDKESRPVLESISPIEEPMFVPEPVLEEKTEITQEEPEIQSFEPVKDIPDFIPEPIVEEKTEIESFEPIENVPEFEPEPIVEEKPEIIGEKPVLETMQPVSQDAEPVAPVSPVYQNQQAQTNFQIPVEVKNEHSKPGFVYYVLLLFLILLSVFTLWLYQKSITGNEETPFLTTKASEKTVVLKPKAVAEPAPVATVDEDYTETVFLDEQPTEQDVEEEPTEDIEPVEEPSEPIVEESDQEEPEEIIEDIEPEEDEEPFIMGSVPSRVNTSGTTFEEEPRVMFSEEEILANKPVYEPGSRHDNMFIDEEYADYEPAAYDSEEGAQFVDEETEYQTEQEEVYY